jgi:outer membrane protein TolC
VAQRQQSGAEIKMKLLTNRGPVATVSARAVEPAGERQAAMLEAGKALVNANSRVAELTQTLNLLMGEPLETQLELAEPEPMIETISSGGPVQQAVDSNPEVVEAQQSLVKARAAAQLSKLEYMPAVGAIWGYSRQTVIPALPGDFSFVGFMATWNVFDFGKRERTVSERTTQVRMAETNLELVRAKVAASVQKASLDVQRTRRIMQLTRQVATMSATMEANYPGSGLEAKAARAQSEAEMYQAELDYRVAYAELKRAMGAAK